MDLKYLVLMILFIAIIISRKTSYNYLEDMNFQVNDFTEIFKEICLKYPDKVALKYKKNKKNHQIKYSEYYDNVYNFSRAVANTNVKKGGCVNILANTCPEWFYFYLGSMMANMIPVGIYNTSSSKTCELITKDTQSQILIVDDLNNVQKFMEVIEVIKIIILIQDSIDDNIVKSFKKYKVDIFTWSGFIDTYANLLDDGNDKENNVATPINTIIYTSGTTGEQKGAALTHKNILSELEFLYNKFKKSIYIENKRERFISYLPLNHIAGQLMDIYIPICLAGSVYIAKQNAIKKNLIKNIKYAKPTIFASVPRIWEKIIDEIEYNKRKLPDYQKILIDIGSTITTYFTDNILKELGLNRCKIFINTGAPLPKWIEKYFICKNIILCNAYGLSETSGPISISLPNEYKFGSVGKILPGIQVKIMNDEILVSGPTVFNGYLNDEESTMKVLDDNGWFKTGDKGRIDNNYLYITGRIKDIIITSGGENVNPVEVEDNIKKNIPFISHVILIGNGRKYITALITMKLDLDEKQEPTIMLSQEAKKYLAEIGSTSTSILEIDDDKIVKKYMNNVINKVNSRVVSNAAKIKKWKFLPTMFTIGKKELTPTLKLRRKFIEDKYKENIDSMYE